MTRDLTRRERLRIPRQEMPEQWAEDRALNFEEVNLGYTPQQAVAEAERCLECGCPYRRQRSLALGGGLSIRFPTIPPESLQH